MAVAAGSSAVQVDAGGEGKRLAYAVTSPQNWIEDFGSGQLQDGEAVVALETVYAEAVSTEQSYHVFLTPLGDCALYVAEKGRSQLHRARLGRREVQHRLRLPHRRAAPRLRDGAHGAVRGGE